LIIVRITVVELIFERGDLVKRYNIERYLEIVWDIVIEEHELVIVVVEDDWTVKVDYWWLVC